jgi:hypothetical protein
MHVHEDTLARFYRAFAALEPQGMAMAIAGLRKHLAWRR